MSTPAVMDAERVDAEPSARSTTGDGWSQANRDRLIDLGFALTLTLLALGALRSAFGGLAPMWIGAAGFAAATVVAAVSNRWRLAPALTVGVAVPSFLLLSGFAVPHVAPLGFLPSPEAISSVLRALVHGWKDSVTTAPPVGVEYGLGIVPFVAGFVAGLGSLLPAWQTKSALFPAIGPVVALAVAISFGELGPASLLLQGAVFAMVAVAWGAVRSHRDRRDISGHLYWPRLIKAAAMIGFLGVLGLAVGGHAIGDAATRDVLRRDVDPPFDPRQYPSPLVGMRTYLADENKDRQVLSVSGLPAGYSLRLATLDTYDGVVWAVGGPGAPGSGRFDRVGTSVTPTPPGAAATVRVTINEYEGVWVPTVGATKSTTFEGDRADDQIAAYRFNRSTGDGVSPVGLGPDDSYRLDVRLQESDRKGADRSELKDPKADASVLRDLPPLPEVPDDLKEQAVQMAQGFSTDYEKAVHLEETFQKGFYSNGGPDKKPYEQSAPGHSMFRLRAFLDPTLARPIGDEEQYAAAMAFVARANNLPARVVMGFTIPEDEYTSGVQEIEGSDADAWVEIAFDGHGWVRFDPTPPRDQIPEEQERDKPTPRVLEVQPEPKQDYLQPPDLEANAVTKGDDGGDPEPVVQTNEERGIPEVILAAGRYVGGPLLFVGAVLASVILLKGLRRRRRRQRGSPVDRLAGAWNEAVDTLRDFGVASERRPTRLEWAATVPEGAWPGAMPLATAVEYAMFAPDRPTDDQATEIWEQVDAQRAELRAPRSFKDRLLAAISIRSLRRWR